MRGSVSAQVGQRAVAEALGYQDVLRIVRVCRSLRDFRTTAMRTLLASERQRPLDSRIGARVRALRRLLVTTG